MKFKSLWMVLIPALAVGCVAQESRQDVSISATTEIGIGVPGTPAIGSATTLGGLVSYRFMVTPRSGLEINYQYSQSPYNFGGLYACTGSTCPTLRVESRFQEGSAAYVYNRNYGNFNPFIEGGIGVFVFTPIKGPGTTVLDTNQNANAGGIYGGGLAYQISPSFDIRAEYRGQLLKVPSFNIPGAKTGVYKNVSDPVIGIAYHF